MMEKMVQDLLGASTVEVLPTRGGGFMNESLGVKTEAGKYFVKLNSKSGARKMFEGEQAGLDAILLTGTVRCPRPVAIQDHQTGPGSILVLEHLELYDLDAEQASTLGEQVARMHLQNKHLGERVIKDVGRVGYPDKKEDLDGEGIGGDGAFVQNFGFHTTTCCGYLPLDNTWSEDWMTFYIRQRLQPQLDLIERDYGDRELMQLWQLVVREVPRLFIGLDRIVPALLHGDLHGGNMAQTMTGPVIFDPASFYGHQEMELAISGLFVNTNPEFLASYHSTIPKAPGFDERQKLYKLFFYLNHWNHLGPHYRGKVITLLEELARH